MNTETDTQPEETTLEQTLDIKEVSACERHVTVTVPRSEIERYYQKQFDDLAPKAELPGFRTGKAPRNLVEAKFRKQVGDQVKGALLMDSLSQVTDADTFSAISEPDLDYEQVNVPDEGPMTYEFNIEVRPEFETPSYTGIDISRPDHEFTDEDVAAHIDRISREHSDLVPVDEPVAPGDLIVCNLKTTHDGETILEEEELTLTVLPTISFHDATLEDFDKLMKGAKADETKTTEVTISEFADNEELQGKTVEVTIEVLDVKRLEKKSDEEVAEIFGLDSFDKLKELITSSLNERLSYEQRETVRNQISSLLTESANWELPPDLLRRQSRRELNRSIMELRSSGFSEQEISAKENVLRQDILQRTERLLKEHFILERIAEGEGIQDEPMDYEIEIAKIAMQNNDSPRRVRARLERNGQMDNLRNMIIERKTIEFITEKANITATEYKMPAAPAVEAVKLSLSSVKSESSIPEAKYEDIPQQTIPGLTNEDS